MQRTGSTRLLTHDPTAARAAGWPAAPCRPGDRRDQSPAAPAGSATAAAGQPPAAAPRRVPPRRASAPWSSRCGAGSRWDTAGWSALAAAPWSRPARDRVVRSRARRHRAPDPGCGSSTTAGSASHSGLERRLPLPWESRAAGKAAPVRSSRLAGVSAAGPVSGWLSFSSTATPRITKIRVTRPRSLTGYLLPLYTAEQPPFKLVRVGFRLPVGRPREPEQHHLRQLGIPWHPWQTSRCRAILVLLVPEQVKADRRVEGLAPSEPAVPQRHDLEAHPSPRAMALSTGNARFQPPPSMARWQSTQGVTRFSSVSGPSWERGRM